MSGRMAWWIKVAGMQQALEKVQALKEEAKTVWVDDKGAVFNQDVVDRDGVLRGIVTADQVRRALRPSPA